MGASGSAWIEHRIPNPAIAGSNPASPVRPPSRTPSASPRAALPRRKRYRELPAARAEREWERYQGTLQRELWLRLRERFLLRALDASPSQSPWVVELGSGPGRFAPLLTRAGSQALLVDLSPAMIREGRRRLGSPPRTHWVLADALRLPIRLGATRLLVALGQLLNLAGGEAPLFLREWDRVLPPGAGWALEVNLEGSSLASPSREKGTETLTRFRLEELEGRLASLGWRVEESLKVAPKAGGEEDSCRRALKRWGGNWEQWLEEEERAGRSPEARGGGGAWLLRGRKQGR